MNKKYNEVNSLRLKGWDYRKPGFYLITICTLYRKHYFGEVKNGIMGLSDIGSIVWKKWYEIPNHKEYINLDEFIVMPDHIHGLLEITSLGSESGGSCRGKTPQTQYQNKFGKPQSRSLSMVINHFKGSVTKWCNKNGFEDFRWQSSFQDEVLFNRNSINRIRKYIQDNPLKWNASGK